VGLVSGHEGHNREHQHTHRLERIDEPPGLWVGEDLKGVADVAEDVGGVSAVVDHGSTVGGDEGVIVDVDHRGVRIDLPRHLMNIRPAEETGADIEELPDPPLSEEPAARRRKARFRSAVSRPSGIIARTLSVCRRSTSKLVVPPIM
jgi:hypothetical protein